MTQPWELSAVEALEAFRDKSLAPSELLDSIRQRIETIDSAGHEPINAITEVLENAAEATKQADQYYAESQTEPIGTGTLALMGLPVVTKEKHFIAGHTISEGLQSRADEIAQVSHPIIERIQSAGGVIAARTTSPEFSCATVTHSPQWGVTRNPWNTHYAPGGSSGGAGAALAAGYAPLATASDIAGSTRIPAGYNGVVGYKAPYGRVPGAGPMASDWYRGDGPMARTVADTALLYNVMAGAHHSDHSTIKSDVSISLSLDEGAEWLRGKRIGLTTNLGGYEVDQYAAGAIQETRKLLEAAGAHVVEVNPGWTSEHVRDVTMAHFGHLLADSMSDSISTFGGEVADYAYQFIHDAKQAAKKMTLWDSLRAEHTMQNELATLLADVEVLIAPVSAVSALEADASYLDGLTFENAQGQTVHLSHYWQAHMTVPFNINNRCPVLALPVPVQEAPIPVGIQIIGKAYDEQAVFNAAYAIEELSPFPGLAPLQQPATANL